jgi:RNA polymerase sigma factor (sigma-70 family)
LWVTPFTALLATPHFVVGLLFLPPLVVAHTTRSSPARSITVFHDDYQEKFDRFTRGIIRRKIKQLIGRAGFANHDWEDLEQDMFLRVLQALKSFDPSQAHRNKFITAVVERYFANVLRDKQAGKRDHRRITSINVMINITDERPTELAQTIGQRELDARRGRHPRSDEEQAQLARDVAESIGKLPVELRKLAERLKSESVSDIARDMGIPRTTLNEIVRRLRRRFENGGLKDYL